MDWAVMVMGQGEVSEWAEVLEWAGVFIIWIKGVVLRSVWYLEISHKDHICNLLKIEGLPLQLSHSCIKDQLCQVNISQGPKFVNLQFKFPRD